MNKQNMSTKTKGLFAIFTLLGVLIVPQSSLADYSAVVEREKDGLNATVYWSAMVDVAVINKPAKEIWPILTALDLKTTKKWNPTVVKVDRISGELGEVGEVVKNTKNTGQTPFFMRVVRLSPPMERVLHIWDDAGMNGYVYHTLTESNGQTTFTYRCDFASYMPAEQADDFAKSINSGGLNDYLAHGGGLLKQLVEGTLEK